MSKDTKEEINKLLLRDVDTLANNELESMDYIPIKKYRLTYKMKHLFHRLFRWYPGTCRLCDNLQSKDIYGIDRDGIQEMVNK